MRRCLSSGRRALPTRLRDKVVKADEAEEEVGDVVVEVWAESGVVREVVGSQVVHWAMRSGREHDGCMSRMYANYGRSRA